MKTYKIALVFFIIPFVFVLSQDMSLRYGDKNLEKIEQMENTKLIQVLNLNEETAVRFFTRRKEYRELQKGLLERRRKLMDGVEELLKSSDKDNASVYKEKLEELLSIESGLYKEKKNFYKSLHNLLSDKQVAQLLLFEDKFRREMRETLMKRNRGKQND
jgi:hypothetical protein